MIRCAGKKPTGIVFQMTLLGKAPADFRKLKNGPFFFRPPGAGGKMGFMTSFATEKDDAR
jgi:hypothetical protein